MRKRQLEISKKHKLDFADAMSVLEDDRGLTIKDQIIEDEQRFATAE